MVFAKEFSAATQAYHLSDHIWNAYGSTEPLKVFGTNTLREYRAYLNKHECHCHISKRHVADLALLRSINDALKHHTLTSTGHRFDDVSAFILGPSESGRLPFGEFKWGNKNLLAVVDKRTIASTGKESVRSVRAVLHNVIDMWERLFIEKAL
ncbi:MAG: hypothetical protein EXQ95_14390 [Alphaproteobacteria bacterium]|nr:hypothetical protein [Alphaproteobacteria bacterium]